ncbi:MAG: 1-phosphofructokinase [Lachnospiraceae bacterium]|nr:1-phosphofructokinase [Lachnospiraceae bacterium]
MVYTVTFNPALDYVVRMDEEIKPGKTNRTRSEGYYYGGKGINVSAILSELEIENTALGFVAGFTGDAIETGVKAMGINTDFIHLKEGLSRINVKIKTKEETEINGRGPKIDQREQNELFKKLGNLTDGDVLVLAGSVPASLPDDIYEKILESIADREIPVVVDSTGDLVRNVLKFNPFLIKPNKDELRELVGRKMDSFDDIYEAALELQEKGAANVLVSMGAEGAMLVDENKKIHRTYAPKGELKNSVGSGDSMVAGFISGFLKSGNYAEALKLGTAAGSATAFSDSLATKEEIEEVYNRM